MPAPVQSTDDFTLKGFLISLVASSGAGMVLAFLFTPSDAPVTPIEVATFGAVGGLLIGLPFMYVERLFGSFIDAFEGNRVRIAIRAVAYMLAALIGFGLGIPTAGLVVFGIVIRPPFAGGLFVPALISTGLAFTIYGYGLLKSRLEASLVRIKEQEFAEKELELARSIQQRLLPPPEIDGNGYGIVARNVPATYVAGDFYDVFHLEDGALGIAVADVSGKGMGASLIMSTAKAMLPLIAAKKSVAETLRELNARLRRDLSRREFVALAFARFDPATGSVELGNAGLPNPFLMHSTGIEEIEVSGPRLPLGVMKDVPYESIVVPMKLGDQLFLFSDGLPEAPTGEGAQLGYEELREILLSRQRNDAASWLDDVLKTIVSRTPNGPDDDCTALVLERRKMM